MRDEKGKPVILIVDDERSNIAALHHILKPTYATFDAINGRTALEIAKRIVPDLILLDIIMPDMTGFEVLAELMREESLRKIPVIIVTALDSPEEEETGFLLGAVDYIPKPFNGSIVIEKVETHLQMKEHINERAASDMTDALTGLPDRRRFDRRLSLEWNRAVREKSSLGILMIDVDKLRNYNARHGLRQGDALLGTVAEIFSKTVKREGSSVFRWEGGEFVILLPDADSNVAREIAEQIRSNVENTPIAGPDGVSRPVTVSIGVHTESPTVDSTILDFISKADSAMNTAKNSGLNRVCSW
jgi:diguanylate cyclase (GGDEF)-like protein